MKKKLLISLGCSFTQGNGIYKPVDNVKDIKQDTEDFNNLENQSIEYMLTLGWPSQLQEMLGYDYLINFGKGGSSNGESVRRLFDVIYKDNLSKFDVTIVLLSTFTHRIGFYRNYQPTTFQWDTEVMNSYIKDITNPGDFILDTIFYIKVLSEFCNNRNYKLVCGLLDGEPIDFYEKELKDTNVHLIKTPIQHKFEGEFKSIVEWDPHPNENGYKIMASTFANEMKEFVGQATTYHKITYNHYKINKITFFNNESNPLHEQ